MAFLLAPYACLPQHSRGRFLVEENCFMRDPIQRDRDRIIHSSAFRRLKHKAQVFIATEGEYYRTRLTHSMEVAQIARGISRAFEFNEDLAEAISLAHDLGHAPFGHAGEDALQDAMAEDGGFNHNDQTFRLLTHLERKYPNFDGLNLTWETLEGIVKHNGPIKGGLSAHPPLRSIYAFCKKFDLELESYPSAEAQVAALSDDIAYNSHDIDDGFRAGLFTLDDVCQVPLVGKTCADIMATYPNLSEDDLIREAIRRLINGFVYDLRQETQRRLEDLKPQSVDDVRNLKIPLVALSDAHTKNLKEIHAFLTEHMYYHTTVTAMKAAGRAIVRDLYAIEKHRHYSPESPVKAEDIADQVAVLTDHEALIAHEKLTGRKYVSPLTSSKRS